MYVNIYMEFIVMKRTCVDWRIFSYIILVDGTVLENYVI